MKKIILFLLSLNSLFIADSQTTSPTFDQAWATRFQALIDSVVNSGSLKGVSIAIYVPGEGTFIGVGGESYNGVPISSDMQFGIGSNSKLVTAALIMKLQELGMLSLEDPISNWLPTYPYIDPSITIRQLLNHQSGLYNVSEGLDSILAAVPDSFYTPEDGLAAMQPAYFAPGEKYKYSNANYLLAPLIIEAVTGKSFVENLHQHIFDPLDLDSTFLSVYETPNGNVAHGWLNGIDMGIMPMKSAYSLQRGGAGIFSTANEMVQWFDHLFNRGFLSQASLNEIINFEPSSNYGLGLEVNSWRIGNITRPNWIHTGEMAGFTSSFGYDVETGSAICILTNDEDYNPILIPLITEFFDNSPRKQHDAGIESVITPSAQQCSPTVTPKVQLINFGTITLTSVVINYKFDAGPVFTYNWTGNLSTGATTPVVLPATAVSQGAHNFYCYTSNPNGNPEGYTYNDDAGSKFYVNGAATGTSLNEDFEGPEFPPQGWNVNNELFDWKRSYLLLLNGKGSVVKNNLVGNSGSYDLELPIMKLTSMNNPVLSFNYAYGYADGYNDGLAVLISTNCGETYHTIFQKSGKRLKTAYAVHTADEVEPYCPNDNEWQLKQFNLSSYKGNEVLIKFRSMGGVGNNLFLDNIKISDVTDLCSTPTDLNELQITSSSVKLSWKFQGNANHFNVYYRPTGTLTWNQKTVSGNKLWVNISGLLSDTDYDWYMTTSCNSGSSLPSPVSTFKTEMQSSQNITSTQTKEANALSVNFLKIAPNPISSNAEILFSLPKSGKVSLTVYDITGKRIRTIANREFNEGTHQIKINTDGIPAGIYVLKLQSKEVLEAKKFVIQH